MSTGLAPCSAAIVILVTCFRLREPWLGLALVAVVGRNPVHEESRENVGLLLRTALDAFAAGVRPDVVHLKGLYLFARDEGYPVKQEWVPSLGEEDAAVAAAVLNRRIDEQAVAPAEVARLRASLELYLAGNTEIRIP